MTYWNDAVGDLHEFNSLYAQVERKPQDKGVLTKCVGRADKMTKLFVWAKKCLSDGAYAKILSAWREIGKIAKTRGAPEDDLRATLERFKTATQEALDGTAPETFTYQGFHVDNREHFADDLCRKTLEGVDFLKALFKKRGVDHLLEQGVARILLVLDAEGSAFFDSGKRELTLSVPELSKARQGRFVDTFTGEAILHEFGHYVHRNFITGEAREAWDEPWGDLQSLADPNTPRTDPRRKEQLDPLEIVTDYGKTDKYEDFAETFMIFMAAPEKLTPTAKYRMQRALSLSGLYGRPVLRMATDAVTLPLRVAARFGRHRV